MNTQNQAPLIYKGHTGSQLELVNVFSTIQGEGPYTGVPAIFIRLAGCNLQCPLCDTDYTSKSNGVHVRTILRMVLDAALAGGAIQAPLEQLTPIKLVVITGGEPFRQNIQPLCRMLLACGFTVQVETNGTVFQPLPPEVQVVVSPKTPNIAHDVAKRAVAFKYVVNGKYREGTFRPVHCLGMDGSAPVFFPDDDFPRHAIYIHPADEQDPALNHINRDHAVKLAMAGGFRFGLQVHKIINLP